MRPGTRLNNVYEIERLVAQGGMGEVYRGFNIQTGDPVAIKMIRPEFASDPEILDLFRREASILHGFTNEAIVRYFVFSVDPELQRAYLAMEFVEGPSLKKRLGSGPLPLDIYSFGLVLAESLSCYSRPYCYSPVRTPSITEYVIGAKAQYRSGLGPDFGAANL